MFFVGSLVTLVIVFVLNALWPNVVLKVLSAVSVREREFMQQVVTDYTDLRKKFTKAP